MKFLFIIFITTFLLLSCGKKSVIIDEYSNNSKIYNKTIEEEKNNKIKLFYNENLSNNSITFDDFKNVLKKDNSGEIKGLNYDEIYFLGEKLIYTGSEINFSKYKLNYGNINNIDYELLTENKNNIYFNKNKQYFYSLGDVYRSMGLCKLLYGIENNIKNLDGKLETSDFGYSDIELLNNIISEFGRGNNNIKKGNSFIYSYENEEKILLPGLLSIVNKYLTIGDKKYIDLFYNEYDKKINKVYGDGEWSTYFLLSKILGKPKSTCENYFNKYYNN